MIKFWFEIQWNLKSRLKAGMPGANNCGSKQSVIGLLVKIVENSKENVRGKVPFLVIFLAKACNHKRK